MRKMGDGAVESDTPLPIPDVRELPLDVVFDQGNTALATAVKGRLLDMGKPAESYAAHSSST